MKANWFKGCKTKAEKDKVRQSIISSRESLDRLKEILGPMLRDTTPVTDYDSPSWAFKQADRLGYNRALTTVLEIINLEE